MKKFTSFLKKAGLFAAAVAVCSGLLSMALSTSKVSASNPEYIDLTPQKIQDLKNNVIDRLASCESAGHSEDYGLVTFDQNASQSLSARNTPSFGVLQFKVTTVQHYVKLRDGKDLTGKEAIMLALDADQAKALASWIVFDQGGLSNWFNCANKLGLSSEVKVLQKLSK